MTPEPTVQKNQIPIIFTKGGQFTVIGGFIIHLKPKPMFMAGLLSENFFKKVPSGLWYYLRDTYSPTSADIMESMKSKFFFLKDKTLFHIFKSQIVYVRFKEGNGASTCVQAPKSKATNKAIPIYIKKNRIVNVKYIVDPDFLIETNYTIKDLRSQQNSDITDAKSLINTNVKEYPQKISQLSFQNEKKDPNDYEIFYVSQNFIYDVPRFPVSKTAIESLQHQPNVIVAEQRKNLENELSEIMKQFNKNKYEQMREFFKENNKSLDIDQNLLDYVCKQSHKNSQNNIDIISEHIFPELVDEWLDSLISKNNYIEKISESYCVVDKYLVSLETKQIVDHKSDEFMNSSTAAERTRIRHADLVDWTALRIVSNPLISESTKLFEYAAHSPIDFREDRYGIIWDIEDNVESTVKTFDTISVDCGRFGTKHILLRRKHFPNVTKINKSETLILKEVGDVMSTHNVNKEVCSFLNDIMEFGSYNKQQSFYTDLFRHTILTFQNSEEFDRKKFRKRKLK